MTTNRNSVTHENLPSVFHYSCSMSDSREFVNKFPDYDPSKAVFNFETKKFPPEIEAPILEHVGALLATLESGITPEVTSDFSVYTGLPGIVLMYLKLADVNALDRKQDFLKIAVQHVESYIPQLKRKYYSFMCGIPGPLAVGAAAYYAAGMPSHVRDLFQRTYNLDKYVTVLHSDIPDELLYGKVGFLYTLLFLKRLHQTDRMDEDSIQKVVNSILDCGKYCSRKSRNNLNFPLFYEWHDKAYFGAAHGFAGILYILLQAKDYISADDLQNLVKVSIDVLLSQQFPSGNFPSSLGSSTDRLVHWCHGAPGAIYLMLSAYETFHEDKYLVSARNCGEVIWKQGLLKKGYGLCHGTAGNGYAFLRLFQVTKEEIYLYRALKFAEWCFDYGKHGCRTADRPLSLFEGMAGTIYFLCDLLNPFNAAFPAFQL